MILINNTVKNKLQRKLFQSQINKKFYKISHFLVKKEEVEVKN